MAGNVASCRKSLLNRAAPEFMVIKVLVQGELTRQLLLLKEFSNQFFFRKLKVWSATSLMMLFNVPLLRGSLIGNCGVVDSVLFCGKP